MLPVSDREIGLAAGGSALELAGCGRGGSWAGFVSSDFLLFGSDCLELLLHL